VQLDGELQRLVGIDVLIHQEAFAIRRDVGVQGPRTGSRLYSSADSAAIRERFNSGVAVHPEIGWVSFGIEPARRRSVYESMLTVINAIAWNDSAVPGDLRQMSGISSAFAGVARWPRAFNTGYCLLPNRGIGIAIPRAV